MPNKTRMRLLNSYSNASLVNVLNGYTITPMSSHPLGGSGKKISKDEAKMILRKRGRLVQKGSE